MTGLSVLYATEAAKELDWTAVPARQKMSRLREVYWARRAELKTGRQQFGNATLNWWTDRASIGRRSDQPADGFVYLVSMAPRVEGRFEWLEVTEVFTTVPPSRIEGAMRAWNGIPNKRPVEFEEFRSGLKLGRPSGIEQQSAADQVIKKVEEKLAKASYQELLERYGYGTLVVGMPLWFAVPPDDPFRAENASDDFIARTRLGLEQVRQSTLQRQYCPFRKVIVIWDTTPQALREWCSERSALDENAANAGLEGPLRASLLRVLPDALEKAILKTGTPESKAPSMTLHLLVEAHKEASGRGPYPEFVEAFSQVLHEIPSEG